MVQGVQFAGPRLPSGDYDLRIWYQPFQPNTQPPASLIRLNSNHLNGASAAYTQDMKIGEDNVKIKAWGDPQERSITIKLTCQRPQVLRNLLVDLFVEDSTSNAKNGLNFAIRAKTLQSFRPGELFRFGYR